MTIELENAALCEEIIKAISDYNAGKLSKSDLSKYSVEDRHNAQLYWTNKSLEYYFPTQIEKHGLRG